MQIAKGSEYFLNPVYVPYTVASAPNLAHFVLTTKTPAANLNIFICISKNTTHRRQCYRKLHDFLVLYQVLFL